MIDNSDNLISFLYADSVQI